MYSVETQGSELAVIISVLGGSLNISLLTLAFSVSSVMWLAYSLNVSLSYSY